MNTRLCCTCGAIKPLDAFHVTKRGKMIRQCEECFRAAFERRVAASIRHNMSRRLVSHVFHKPDKSAPCSICGHHNDGRRYYHDLCDVVCPECRARLDDACRSFKRPAKVMV